MPRSRALRQTEGSVRAEKYGELADVQSRENGDEVEGRGYGGHNKEVRSGQVDKARRTDWAALDQLTRQLN